MVQASTYVISGRTQAALSIALLILTAGGDPANAQTADPSVKEAVRQFNLSPTCRRTYEKYLKGGAIRAFATNRRGQCGYAANYRSPEAAQVAAIGFCQRGNAEGCTVVATFNGFGAANRAGAEVGGRIAWPPDVPSDEPTDPAALGLNGTCRELYETYLLGAPNRAFARSSDARCGYATGHRAVSEARKAAIEQCGKLARWNCEVIASAESATVPDGLTSAIQPLALDPLFRLHGPSRAMGAIIWSHGRAVTSDGRRSDRRSAPTATIIRALGNTGWDVYRADRPPLFDTNTWGSAAVTLGVEKLRALGYKRIILAGQSAGGWISLTAMDRIDGLYAVVALSPATHGNLTVRTTQRASALREFDELLGKRRSPATRVVIAFFEDDDYDPDPTQRARIARERAQTPGIPLLLIDRPGELSGHTAGTELPMAQRFAACLRDFVGRPSVATGVATCRQ
jgi:pimeloyl-ACP methyl ester carboxylesterase